MLENIPIKQIENILDHLPVQLTFADANDIIRYYSHSGKRMTTRTPDILGTTVQSCHPPKSVPVVQQILDDFKSGKRNVAEFWLRDFPSGSGRFLHIRYIAVRNKDNEYEGVLEVHQDINDIQKIEGEKRSLD